MSAIALPPPVPVPLLRFGRAFVHPSFDLLVIGSLSSLVLAPVLLWSDSSAPAAFLERWLAVLVLLSNSAHFAASTVRLYSRPGALADSPWLTMALPAAALLALTVAIAFAGTLGAPLQALYLTWSPYHYAAQAYGLTLMYAYRSGCAFGDGERRWLRAACLAPFLAAVVGGRLLGEGGLEARAAVATALGWASFVLPLALFARRGLLGLPSLPLISMAVLLSNAVWLVALNRAGVFAWATIFHGLQYLAIVTLFHVRDQQKRPGNAHGAAWHAATFYAGCLALGYLLFEVLPFAYVLAGFGVVESLLLVAAVINIHHFVVDAFIWRLRKDPNYAIVTDPA